MFNDVTAPMTIGIVPPRPLLAKLIFVTAPSKSQFTPVHPLVQGLVLASQFSDGLGSHRFARVKSAAA